MVTMKRNALFVNKATMRPISSSIFKVVLSFENIKALLLEHNKSLGGVFFHLQKRLRNRNNNPASLD